MTNCPNMRDEHWYSSEGLSPAIDDYWTNVRYYWCRWVWGEIPSSVTEANGDSYLEYLMNVFGDVPEGEPVDKKIVNTNRTLKFQCKTPAMHFMLSSRCAVKETAKHVSLVWGVIHGGTKGPNQSHDFPSGKMNKSIEKCRLCWLNWIVIRAFTAKLTTLRHFWGTKLRYTCFFLDDIASEV